MLHDASLLIVDDEKNTRDGLALAFSDKFEVFTAENPEEALRLMDDKALSFDVILTDLRMGRDSGLTVVQRALRLPNKPACILMTAYGTVETAVEAMKQGAYDFVAKPVSLEKLECLVARAMADRQSAKVVENAATPFAMLGTSPAFRELMQKIQRVAPAKTTVLITGETGTGKELAAHQLHTLSLRADKTFVPVHCAALPSHLLESELFGHERGAFTGALQRHIGWFESANKGTLFLDEIGEIPLNVQVKLLRFLETKSVERLGSTQSIPLDVRLVCATNRNLPNEIKAGRFREDLYYRLNVVELRLPPLRERTEDIEVLLKHYLNFFAKENHLPTPRVADDVLSILQRYLWPGNVRELRNFAENTVIMHSGHTLEAGDLDPKFTAAVSMSSVAATTTASAVVPAVPTVTTFSPENEKSQLAAALAKTRGNRSEAARLLNMPRRTFYRKLEKFGLL
jgi:DNA-binding NtrC family response regulator